MTGECPHRSVGSVCKQCQIERSLTKADTEWYPCPVDSCDGETSGPGIVCFRHRGENQ